VVRSHGYYGEKPPAREASASGFSRLTGTGMMRQVRIKRPTRTRHHAMLALPASISQLRDSQLLTPEPTA